MNAIDLIEKDVVKKKVPEFRVGDTLKVYLKVKEGDKTRIQIYEGTCARKRGKGAGASFTVLKESHGELIEKIFPIYSPSIDKIVVSRKSKVRRAKLYHLRKKK